MARSQLPEISFTRSSRNPSASLACLSAESIFAVTTSDDDATMLPVPVSMPQNAALDPPPVIVTKALEIAFAALSHSIASPEPLIPATTGFFHMTAGQLLSASSRTSSPTVVPQIVCLRGDNRHLKSSGHS